MPARTLLAIALLLLLGAGGLSAEPVLSRIDSFQGMAFIRASRLAVSADGAFIYALQSNVGLSVLRRDDTGVYRYVTSHFPWNEDETLRSIGNFVLGPGETQVYTTGSDTIAVLDRDAETGLLMLAQALLPSQNGMPVFDDPGALAFSSGGETLYVGVRDLDAQRILVLGRDPADGTLSLVQEIATDASDAQQSVKALLPSPDGEHLYVLGKPSVAVYDRDPGTGELAFVEAMDWLSAESLGIYSTRMGAISPDGAHVYAFGGNSCYNSCYEEGLAVLSRDPVSGGLTLLEADEDTIGPITTAIEMSPDGRHVYLANRDEGLRVSIYERDAGGLLEPGGHVDGQAVSVFTDVTAMTFDAAGSTLYASGHEDRPLVPMTRDVETGELTVEPRVLDAEEGITGPLEMVVSPDGGNLYVLGYLSQSIASFAWDEEAGALRPLGAVFRLDEGLNEMQAPIRLRINRDGSRLYSLGEYGPMTVFACDDAGELELIGHFETAVGDSVALEISPDGDDLYLLGFNALAVMSRDAADQLTVEQTIAGAAAYRDLALSPDARHAYVLAGFDCGEESACWQLDVFERDPATGLLDHRDTVSGFGSEAFDSPRSLAISPDGAHLYFSSVQDETAVIGIFSRDAADGSLELTGVHPAGEVETPDWDEIRLRIAPDGRYVYTSRSPNTVSIFARDPESGLLSDLEPYVDDELGTGTRGGATGLAVSPGGGLVFAAGFARSRITTLSSRCLANVEACAQGDRFRISVDWRDYEGRTGNARRVEPLGDSTRVFWFFDQNNWEMMVKVLDGCAINERFWVFAAATTDVETTLTVTDTWTGESRSYFNALGVASPAITDTGAFDACDP
ncbi:MAG: lactonase family protein [bacterium]|nr:lactonase family protein [bacterium]